MENVIPAMISSGFSKNALVHWTWVISNGFQEVCDIISSRVNTSPAKEIVMRCLFYWQSLSYLGSFEFSFELFSSDSAADLLCLLKSSLGGGKVRRSEPFFFGSSFFGVINFFGPSDCFKPGSSCSSTVFFGVGTFFGLFFFSSEDDELEEELEVELDDSESELLELFESLFEL